MGPICVLWLRSSPVNMQLRYTCVYASSALSHIIRLRSREVVQYIGIPYESARELGVVRKTSMFCYGVVYLEYFSLPLFLYIRSFLKYFLYAYISYA